MAVSSAAKEALDIQPSALPEEPKCWAEHTGQAGSDRPAVAGVVTATDTT